jgi:hypothetical protein
VQGLQEENQHLRRKLMNYE